MNHLMTKEESYAERRKLFKNIWETSMLVGEKDDIMNKPKIIKTLRLDEMDRTTAGKKKKQKIKNLRTVCNKLLDFCDRQDADDLFYEQMASHEREQPPSVIEINVKKKKQIKVKRKIKKANSMFAPTTEATLSRAITSERKEDYLKDKKTSRYTSPLKFKRTSTGLATKKISKSKQSPRVTRNKNLSGDGIISQKKKIKKKRSKRNNPFTQFPPPGPRFRYKYSFPSLKQLQRKKRFLQIHKINIS